MIHLIVNYFKHPDPQRRHEIDYCLKTNYANKYISDITEVSGRPTYTDMFKHAKPECINVISNADIYFDHTIRYAKAISSKESYCITRWEDAGNACWGRKFKVRELFLTQGYSQDVWVFKGVPKVIANFHMGKWGCDNRLAYEIQRAGYKLSNPARKIVCTHKHRDEKRKHTRTHENTVPGPYTNVPIDP